MRYDYRCYLCGNEWEDDFAVEYRDLPTTQPCEKCGEYGVIRLMATSLVQVLEGGCGNSKNGYSSTHGDSENFKSGRKIY